MDSWAKTTHADARSIKVFLINQRKSIVAVNMLKKFNILKHNTLNFLSKIPLIHEKWTVTEQMLLHKI
jgi:hypothetical protein